MAALTHGRTVIVSFEFAAQSGMGQLHLLATKFVGACSLLKLFSSMWGIFSVLIKSFNVNKYEPTTGTLIALDQIVDCQASCKFVFQTK